MKNKTLLFAALLAATCGSVSAGEVMTGEAAVAKFPEGLRGMGLKTAKWMQLTNGVEYFYGYFTNLLGTVPGYPASTNALHMLRIDYRHSPVRMKFVDHTQEKTKRWTTSKTAAHGNALFAINMMMEDGNNHPQGYAKANGTVIPNGAELSSTGVTDGFAFNDDKSFMFAKKWTETDPATGQPKAEPWENIVTLEAYTVHNGKVTWGPEAHWFGRANYPFFGTTADGVLWACTVDGRCANVSDGLGYHEVAALQLQLGCVEGVCCDGGGSTTMVIRKDLMTASDICPTQETSSFSDDYYTMNFLYDGSGGRLPNGYERAVINQLLFVEGSREKAPIVLDEPTSRPSTNYNGSAVSLSFSGDVPDGAEMSARVTVEGVDYPGTIEAEGACFFTVPADVVTAGRAYSGTITLTIDGVEYRKPVSFVQGRLVVDEKTDWICETPSALNATGTWSGDKVAVENGRICVSNASFMASTPSPGKGVVTLTSVFEFGGPNDETVLPPSSLAGVKVVSVEDVNRYAFLTGEGVVTNLETVANTYGTVTLTTRFDFSANRMTYTIGDRTFGPFGLTGAGTRVSGVCFDGGETRISSLSGEYRLEEINTNLAMACETEFATVSQALDAAGETPVTLLWDASWNPTQAGAYTIRKGEYGLEIGGSLAYRVKDNEDGTITVTVSGGAEPVDPALASITIVGGKVRVAVSNAQADLWYALEKTDDLRKPFVVDSGSWVSGADLISATRDLEISLGEGEMQGFYRVVVSADRSQD